MDLAIFQVPESVPSARRGKTAIGKWGLLHQWPFRRDPEVISVVISPNLTFLGLVGKVFLSGEQTRTLRSSLHKLFPARSAQGKSAWKGGKSVWSPKNDLKDAPKKSFFVDVHFPHSPYISPHASPFTSASCQAHQRLSLGHT